MRKLEGPKNLDDIVDAEWEPVSDNYDREKLKAELLAELQSSDSKRRRSSFNDQFERVLKYLGAGVVVIGALGLSAHLMGVDRDGQGPEQPEAATAGQSEQSPSQSIDVLKNAFQSPVTTYSNGVGSSGECAGDIDMMIGRDLVKGQPAVAFLKKGDSGTGLTTTAKQSDIEYDGQTIILKTADTVEVHGGNVQDSHVNDIRWQLSLASDGWNFNGGTLKACTINTKALGL